MTQTYIHHRSVWWDSDLKLCLIVFDTTVWRIPLFSQCVSMESDTTMMCFNVTSWNSHTFVFKKINATRPITVSPQICYSTKNKYWVSVYMYILYIIIVLCSICSVCVVFLANISIKSSIHIDKQCEHIHKIGTFVFVCITI